MDHCLCPWWLRGWEPWKNGKWWLHTLHPRKQELRLGVPVQRRDSTHNRLWVNYYWPIRGLYSNFWPIRSRQTTEECPDAIIMQCVQSIVGVIIQECKHVKTSAKIKKVFSLRDARQFEIFILTTLNAQVVQRVKRVLFHYDIKRSLAREEWFLYCLIWCQLKSDFSWGLDGLYSRLAWPASYLLSSPGPRKLGTPWSSQSELLCKLRDFMTFFICPQTVVNSWFTAWNFSINNVNESLNVKHGTVVTRL